MVQMVDSEQMLFLSGVKWLKWRPERSSYLETIVSIHRITLLIMDFDLISLS